MIELNQLRNKLDEVDSKLISLFKKRLEISKKIGKYKKENDIEILDLNREEKVIKKFLSSAQKEEKKYIEIFLHFLMDTSKEVQKNCRTLDS